MSAKPARHLALVELDDAGEITGRVDSEALKTLEARAEKAETNFRLAEKDLASKRRIIANLERDRIRERLEHPDREFIKRVCLYWHRKCRRKDFDGPKRLNPLSPDRFDAVAALAEMEMIVTVEVDGKRKRERRWRYEAEHFKAAIDAGEFDPYTPIMKNGKPKPQNDLEQICRNVSKFEAWIEKAPYVLGTWGGGDLVVPAVPGFTRLSPQALAEARMEAHTGERVPSTRLTQPQVGGSNAHRAVGDCDRGDAASSPAGRLLVRARLEAGPEGAPV